MLDYSPLCDVSYSAYVAYLAANIADKGRHDVFVSVFRGRSGGEFDGRCLDVGSDVSVVDSGRAGAVVGDAVAGLCDASVKDWDDGDDNSGVGDAGERAAGAQRGAGDLFGSGSDTAVGIGRDSVFRKTSEQVLDGGSVVGRWSKSNKRKKEKKKASRRSVELLAADVGIVGGETVVSVGAIDGSGVAAGVGEGVRGCSVGLAEVEPASVGGSVVQPSCDSTGSKDGLSLGVVGSRESRVFDRGDLERVVSVGERGLLAREWYERKRAENALATQRARYNFKRNEYLDRARISEKKWEQERLTCEQKLARITEARFGSKPGYAETLASLSDGSERPPSLSTDGSSPANLSDGTISPDSSMSVAEANRLLKKVEEVSERLVKLELENKSLRSLTVFKGGHVEEENGKFYSFDGTGQYVPPTPELGSECELYSMGDYPEELQYS